MDNKKWETILKNYIQANSSAEDEEYKIKDAKNAAAEYAGVFGNKNKWTSLDVPFDPIKGTTWYPVELIKQVEPNKWQSLLKYLNSDNYDAPNYRN